MIKLVDGYFLAVNDPYFVSLYRTVYDEETGENYEECVSRFDNLSNAVERAKEIICNVRIAQAGDISLDEAEQIMIRAELDVDNLRYNPEKLFYTE